MVIVAVIHDEILLFAVRDFMNLKCLEVDQE